MEKKKALIAMSGGVDSSVAAALMVKAGYECIGCTMKLYSPENGSEGNRTCCSLDDTLDARRVADALGMSYYVLNFSSDFESKVIDKFIRIYEAGGTPNPCIDCNRYMKFARLSERAGELGCDLVVTGHYARVRKDEESGRWLLLRSSNPDKDQTYVLYPMTQKQLAHTCFPLGEYDSKQEVRRIAAEYGFVNARKPDSQDICFVPDGNYAAFIEKRTGRKYQQGNFVDEEGRVLGINRGLIHYTIGQRKGLGLSSPQPLYVKKKDPETGDVVLTTNEGLFTSSLVAEDFNWISIEIPQAGTEMEVTAKPRYRAPEAPAHVRVLEDGRVEVLFHEPQRALTAGQAVVLYDGEKVVGGGTICWV